MLGPPLWNTYFSDVLLPAEQDGGEAHAFADDMNVFKQFDTDMDNEAVLEDMQRTRRNVHKWGRQNRVIFDAGKEHLVVLHPLSGEGDAFKLLGCMVDTKLTMQYAVDAILAAARPKTRAILRTRSHYDVPTLISQFKTHVWGLIEIHQGAIFHAAATHLNKLDHLQDSFLRELGISCEEAFIKFNFAPVCLRRDIGILGMLHKRVLG